MNNKFAKIYIYISFGWVALDLHFKWWRYSGFWVLWLRVLYVVGCWWVVKGWWRGPWRHRLYGGGVGCGMCGFGFWWAWVVGGMSLGFGGSCGGGFWYMWWWIALVGWFSVVVAAVIMGCGCSEELEVRVWCCGGGQL